MPVSHLRNGARIAARSTKHVPLTDVLPHLREAVALAETVARALDAADGEGDPEGVAAASCALQQAVRALHAVYDELDLAIPSAAA